MSNSTFILTANDIPHHIPLFNIPPLSLIAYTSSYLYHHHLPWLLFNLTTFLRCRSSYILVATFIIYLDLLLFSSLLVHELTSYNSLYFTFKSFISIIYYVVHCRHIAFILSSYFIILQRSHLIHRLTSYLHIIYIVYVFVISTSCLEHTSIISCISIFYIFYPSDRSYPSFSVLRYFSLHLSLLTMFSPYSFRLIKFMILSSYIV
jgi:hypothetical protein